MAIKSLDEVLKIIIGWERKLKYLYDMLEETLTDVQSKAAVAALKKRHNKNLEVFDRIKIEDYKNTEFLKNVPDYNSESIIPRFEISVNSSPKEIFSQILAYEEKLEEFYIHVRTILVYTKSKDLFDMLVDFKMGQIKEIRRLMDSYDLVV